MAHIKSIHSVSLGKVLGIMYMILSLVFSPFFFLIAARTTSISGAAVVLFVIVFYGIMGVIAGLLIEIKFPRHGRRKGTRTADNIAVAGDLLIWAVRKRNSGFPSLAGKH